MDTQSDLLAELQKINQKLDKISHQNQYSYIAITSFSSGLFRTLGSLVGYTIILLILIWATSKINLTQLTSQWIQSTMSQVDWSKVVPQPKLNLDLNNLQIR